MSITKRQLTLYMIEVQKNFEKTYAESKSAEPKVEVSEGKKFFKIVSEVYGSKSVHSFVDKETGDIFKPASWAAPAKHARGNILSQKRGAEALDRYGIKYLR